VQVPRAFARPATASAAVAPQVFQAGVPGASGAAVRTAAVASMGKTMVGPGMQGTAGPGLLVAAAGGSNEAELAPQANTSMELQLLLQRRHEERTLEEAKRNALARMASGEVETDLKPEASPEQAAQALLRKQQLMQALGNNGLQRTSEEGLEDFFTVVVDKSGGGSLGIDVEGEGDTLVVTDVEAGLVSMWNDAHKTKVVRKGDRILTVNGSRGDGQSLINMVVSNMKVELAVMRETVFVASHRQRPPEVC